MVEAGVRFPCHLLFYHPKHKEYSMSRKRPTDKRRRQARNGMKKTVKVLVNRDYSNMRG